MVDISLIPITHRRINDPGEIKVANYIPWLEYCVVQRVKEKGATNKGEIESIRSETLEDILSGIDQLTVVEQGVEKKLTIEYFDNEENWVNNAFNLAFFETIVLHLKNPNPWSDIAHFALMHRSKKLKFAEKRNKLRLGPEGIYLNADRENARWNNTKEVETVELTENTVVLRLHYRNDITADSLGRQVTKHVCNWNKALYEQSPTLFNLWPMSLFNPWRISPAYLEETKCVTIGSPYCEFVGTYERIKDPLTKFLRKTAFIFDPSGTSELVDSLFAHLEAKSRESRTNREEAQKLAVDLLRTEEEKHLLEMDLALGLQLQEIMHTDSSILISPLSAHLNVSADVLGAYRDYRAALVKGYGIESAFADLESEIDKMERTHTIGRGVLDDYRRNFKALHELRASDNPNRNPNKDLKYLQALVNSQFAFTNAELELELADNIPTLNLTRRVQASYLEIAINAVRHGKSTKLLARTELIKAGQDTRFTNDMIGIHIYNNGAEIRDMDKLFEKETGWGLYSSKARIELNKGVIVLEKPDREGYNVHFAVYLPIS